MQARKTLLTAAALVACFGCDSGTSPVAPKEGVLIRITANPPSISLDGSSAIEVELLDAERGTPLREGTEVRLTTTLGTIEPVVAINRDGIAHATLQADGRAGSARVTATSGASARQEVMVTIGSSDVRADFTFTVNGFTVSFEDDSTGEPTSWSWDFGDGATSTRREPTHTYASADTFLVRLTVANPDGSDTIAKNVVVTGGLTAAFEFNVDGLTVSFTDTSEGGPTAWEWDFGDGATSRERHPVHTYAAAGSYRVTLTVSDSVGSATISKVIPVESGAPEADFSHRAQGLTVTFTDSSTGDPDAWQWSFGDGGTSLVENPVHTYAAPGTYRVTLTASNSAGSDTTSQVIEVDEAQRPRADFSFVVNGLNVDFTDRSTNEPENWMWDFDDNGTIDSTEQNPAHRYPDAGTFTVTLTVSNDAGESIVSKDVTVQ